MAGSLPTDLGAAKNWAELQRDVLEVILSKLILPDFIRFSLVCKSWLSVALDHKQKRMETINQQVPMLMIPQEGSKEHWNFYSLCENKVYNYQFQVPHRVRCCGSSYGWWAMAEKDLSIKLVNPFSGKTIHLPPIMVAIPGFYSVPEYYIHRVILSCDPCLHPNNYVVAAMYDCAPAVAFIKSGEQSWTYVYKKFTPVRDILFHEGQLYAVNSMNQLLVIDYEGNDSSDDSEDEDEDEDDDEVEYYEGPRVEYLISLPSEYSHVSYLVESFDGGLLLVRRCHLEIIDDITQMVDNINYKVTVGFKIYRMTRKNSNDDEEPEWVEMKSLPDIALFVGDNHSICIPAFGFPNCQSNCIYFTDDCTERNPHAPYEATDMGIFHLESGQIRKHYELPQSLSYLPPAVWILPKLQ